MVMILKQIFTWWHSQTIGTRLYTWRKGLLVGTDQFGNRYYQNKQKNKRWVIYQGETEASTVPPGWYGWLHHKMKTPPTEKNENYIPKKWERNHLPNQTGTPQAWKPPGSLRIPAGKRKSWQHYTPWKPNPENQSKNKK